jgi:hypothetical protein
MNKPETCILRVPRDLKCRLQRAAKQEGLSLNQWALYNLSQSVAFTEAYRELQVRLDRADLAKAKDAAWRLLKRPTLEAPRPAWDMPPRGWGKFEEGLALGIPQTDPVRKRAGRPRATRASR